MTKDKVFGLTNENEMHMRNYYSSNRIDLGLTGNYLMQHGFSFMLNQMNQSFSDYGGFYGQNGHTQPLEGFYQNQFRNGSDYRGKKSNKGSKH